MDLKNKLNNNNIDIQLLDKNKPIILKAFEYNAEKKQLIGYLILPAHNTKEGTRIIVEQVENMPNYSSLHNIFSGDNPSKKDDIIFFESSFLRNGKAIVGPIIGKTNENMSGPVQIMSALLRITGVKVSKKGAAQYATIINPEKSKIVKSYEDIHNFLEEIKKITWPGGAYGFILRTDLGKTKEFFVSENYNEKYIINELEALNIFSEANGKIELIPSWSLPTGFQQMARDINLKNETNGNFVTGNFSKIFEKEKIREKGFIPCIMILSNENEYAFGAKKAERRVISSIQPLSFNGPISIISLTTSCRKFKSNINIYKPGFLFSEEEINKKISIENQYKI